MLEYRDRFEHHLMLRTSGEGIAETRAYLEDGSECNRVKAIVQCRQNERQAGFSRCTYRREVHLFPIIRRRRGGELRCYFRV